MPLQIIRDDITKVKCDAIVNAANKSLLGGGGVDGAIHKAAGKKLLKECQKLGGCETGKAKITGAYDLPCKYVIHTVGPIWRGGDRGEKELLTSCYRESLELAKENECKSVAFPLISAGAYGYPKDEALQIAVNEITNFLMHSDMLVYIVVYDKNSFQLSQKLSSDIEQYIDENYIKEHPVQENRIIEAFHETSQNHIARRLSPVKRMSRPAVSSERADEFPCECSEQSGSLSEIIGKQIDESFSEMLMRKIDEKEMTDAQCYKKANIDRKLFSKIRSDRFYKPSKQTAIAFAIALELSLDETRDMLMKAGYALSHSYISDIIIEFFIKSGNYNIFEINEALFKYDQNLLGA